MQVLSRQRGVSLIEILVAMLIFSVGVLGVALMQIKGAQFGKQASARTMAVLQAQSLADSMRANPAGVVIPSASAGDLSGSYYIYNGTSAPDPSSCTTGNNACLQAIKDLTAWLALLKSGTATPLATVQAHADTGTLIVKVVWKSMNPGSTDDTITDSYQFDYQP
jgi:type IV pilus assembly protein PilV